MSDTEGRSNRSVPHAHYGLEHDNTNEPITLQWGEKWSERRNRPYRCVVGINHARLIVFSSYETLHEWIDSAPEHRQAIPITMLEDMWQTSHQTLMRLAVRTGEEKAA